MTPVGMNNIDGIVAFYRGARFIATHASTRWRRLEVGILGLSVVTTGSLWTAISDVQPDATLWIGAVLATVTAFLSGYMKYTNYHQIIGEALSLHSKVGDFLGAVRASPNMTEEEFWPRYKQLETELESLEVRSGIPWREAYHHAA